MKQDEFTTVMASAFAGVVLSGAAHHLAISDTPIETQAQKEALIKEHEQWGAMGGIAGIVVMSGIVFLGRRNRNNTGGKTPSPPDFTP